MLLEIGMTKQTLASADRRLQMSGQQHSDADMRTDSRRHDVTVRSKRQQQATKTKRSADSPEDKNSIVMHQQTA
jgi:hypothetical protein